MLALHSSWAIAADPGETDWSAVGAGKLTTREPAPGEIRIDTAPFRIAKPGRYILTRDLRADASAIAIQSDDVVLDLNGHTVRYGLGHVPTSDPKGVMTYNSRQKGNVAHSGILCPPRPDATEDFDGWRWNTRYTGVVVRNGRIAEGAGRDLAYTTGVNLAGTRQAVLENVVVDVAAPDAFGVTIGPGGIVRHVTIRHRGRHVSNRHQQVADLRTADDCEVHHCLLDGGPQAGIKVAGRTRVHHNVIRQRATVTNCYGVQGYGQEGVRIDHNRIMPYNGRGIHLSEKSSGWLVHDNYVEVRETANREYSRMQTHGIKLEGARDSRVFRNVVLAVSSRGGEPTPLNLHMDANSGNMIRDNTFIAVSVNDRGAYAAYTVQNDGRGAVVRDNRFLTNNICYYVGPDGGRNLTFRRCSFEPVSPNDDVLFYANRAYKKTGGSADRFVDCIFAKGVDPRSFYFPGRKATWRSDGDYAVAWTVSVTALSGGKPAGGAVVSVVDAAGRAAGRAVADANGLAELELTEFRVVYKAQPAQARVEEPGPYTLAVAHEGKAREVAVRPRGPLAVRVDLAGRAQPTVKAATVPDPPAVGQEDFWRARLAEVLKARPTGPVGVRFRPSADR